ncbi:hypothetical protein TSTA_016250 [Talaromyces stipitatus ATCC 10500]|uniref:Uncharacterized protein n=1 Tax=Talaromyces stipitatus (strain ATCC 10500 / CBS 375.48 / QM 6759 / NRRL 1006) TaxID=441959 RepID=B8MEB9_TALSN|nr:uncharacterized protein TSTA_016250 [Talaromyces stipitatus ATCC 10500]EED16546.1 hypothetical protein TSTA_016250 [Talaromyces stipitatus ATCC 10500]
MQTADDADDTDDADDADSADSADSPDSANSFDASNGPGLHYRNGKRNMDVKDLMVDIGDEAPLKEFQALFMEHALEKELALQTLF